MRKRIFSKKLSDKPRIDISQDDLVFTLEKAWNDLPPDLTFEERVLFIELIEKLIKSYQNYKHLNSEEEAMSKN